MSLTSYLTKILHSATCRKLTASSATLIPLHSPLLRVDADGARLPQVLGDEGAGEAAVAVGDQDGCRAAVGPVHVTRHPVHGQVVRTVGAVVQSLTI